MYIVGFGQADVLGWCMVHVVHKNLISILVTDYIQKRRGQALLFSFEYNMLPNLISNLNHYMDRALGAGKADI